MQTAAETFIDTPGFAEGLNFVLVPFGGEAASGEEMDPFQRHTSPCQFSASMTLLTAPACLNWP